jgi:hypothetical protein
MLQRMRLKADRPTYYSCESGVCEYFVCAFRYLFFVFLGFQQLQLLVIVFVPGEKGESICCPFMRLGRWPDAWQQVARRKDGRLVTGR